MQIIDILEAEIRLPQLVEQAAQGKPFIIAKAGKPLVKVLPIDTTTSRPVRRLGFLSGEITVPADFDRMGGANVQQLFENGY